MYKILFPILLFFSLNSYAQEYLDTIAESSCGCLLNLSDTLDQETKIMRFGLCIIDAAMPYNERIKKDYEIDFLNDEDDGERLGQLIGMRMATICPTELMAIATSLTDEESGDEFQLTDNVRGVVERISKDEYVKFYVRRGDNKLITLHWITEIESDFDMPFEYEDLVSSELLFHYEEIEVFDPRINEYRSIYFITMIEE